MEKKDEGILQLCVETSKNSTVIVSDVKVCKIWRTACLPVVYSEYNIGRASIPDNRNC